MKLREETIRKIRDVFKALATMLFLLSIGFSGDPEKRKLIYSALKIIISAHVVFNLYVMCVHGKDDTDDK